MGSGKRKPGAFHGEWSRAVDAWRLSETEQAYEFATCNLSKCWEDAVRTEASEWGGNRMNEGLPPVAGDLGGGVTDRESPVCVQGRTGCGVKR